MSAKASKEPSKQQPNFEELRFVRVFTPMHVPRRLIERIKRRDYSVDDWFKYQEIMCIRQTPQGPQLDPFNLLYVVADADNVVVGVLWCVVDQLSKALVVQTFSMDDKYWFKGKIINLLSDKAKEIARECKLQKIFWMTDCPRACGKHGFKASKTVLMEWDEDDDKADRAAGGKVGKDIDGRQAKASGSGTAGNPGTDAIPERCSWGDGSTSTRSDQRLSAAV